MECGSGQYNILGPPPFSARAVYAIKFNGIQHEAMATPEAIHCIGCAKDISKSSRDGRKLVPFHWQPSCKIASSVCMEEVSLQEATAEISLQSIQAIKKEREKSISKGSFRTPLEGW